jgi:hypothetical protein
MKTTLIIAAILASAFPAFAGNKSKKSAEGKRDPEAVFKKLDSNSDGNVTKEEFLASKKAKKDPAKATKRFEKADANHDGKISKEEVVAIARHKKKTDTSTPAPAVKPEEKKPGEGDKPAEKPVEKA